MKTKTFRMTLKSYRKLRRIFEPEMDETFAEYMNRVVDHIEKLQNANIFDTIFKPWGMD
jgi:hypothetical protein